MNTLIVKTDESHIEETLKICTELLKSGELVAFPTETVYGLGGNGLDADASRKIYAAKGRPSDNPLILHIGEKDQLYGLVKSVPESAEKLMDAFWPGPLTMILPKADCVPYATSGGLDTVAVRMPSHPVAHALLKYSRIPVAAPSANLSGRPSPTTLQHVIDDMDGRIAAIMDGGSAGIGVESTIIDLTGEVPMLLRPGYITKEQLEAVLGTVEEDPAIRRDSIIHHTNAVAHPKAPGMKYRHYAPKAEVTVLYGTPEEVAAAVNRMAKETSGILTVEEHKGLYPVGKVLSVGTLKDPETVAHNLFDVLRQFDDLSVTEIYSEDFTDIDIGTAIMNRLLKAAGGRYYNAKNYPEGENSYDSSRL